MNDLQDRADFPGIAKIMHRISLWVTLAACACLSSCDEAKDQRPTRNTGSNPASRENVSEKPLSKESIRGPGQAALSNVESLSPAALEEAFQSASQVIREKKLTPESDGAESLELNLTRMLRNGDSRIYDLISQLPPGYYSESIVHNAFMRARFPDIQSLFDACDRIQEKDLHRAAINGAASALKMEARSAGTSVNVTRHDIAKLRAAGLENLPSLIVQGVVSGNLETADIVTEINDRDNLMLSAALNELPAAKAKEVFMEALKQEKPVGPEAVHWLALSLFRESPTDAVSWFSQFPPETAARGTRGVVREWMAAEPLAASAFVGSMPSGSPKDAAVAVIVSDCLLNGDQETATAWAKQISDEGLREKTQARIMGSKKR